MPSQINIFIAILWFLSALADYNRFCYILQLKEYRFDKIRDFLSTRQGRAFLTSFSVLWRSVLAVGFLLWPINSVLTLKYFIILFFAADLGRNTLAIAKHRLARPVFTKKSVLIILLALVLEAGIFTASRELGFLLGLVIIRLPLIVLAVWLFSYPTWLAKKYYIRRAAAILAKYPRLTVIGITGSYGKTSVKTFLAQILGGQYRVLKTPKNINTEIGIANFILKHSFHDIDIFIVEMGAYKIGEIKLICDMVRPKIGILTAITAQHLSLFGDIKYTQAAKYELLRALPADGLAVVNSDNALCREYLRELKCRVATFGVEAEYNPTFLIEEINHAGGGIMFSGKLNGENITARAPILGIHNAKNLAPGYLVADFLGMKAAKVGEQISQINLPENTLALRQYGRSIVIDDSYNANYDGFCAALDVLSTFPSEKKRVVITRGIPELGEKSVELHQKLGEEIAYVADWLVIIDKNFAAPLRLAAEGKYNLKVELIENYKSLLHFLRTLKNEEAVILIENRVPEIIKKELLK